jgi:hypothetical protein
MYVLMAETLSRMSKLPEAPEAKKVSGLAGWVGDGLAFVHVSLFVRSGSVVCVFG